MPLFVPIVGATNKPFKIDMGKVAYRIAKTGILVLKPVLDTVTIVYQAHTQTIAAQIAKRINEYAEAGYQKSSLKHGQGPAGHKVNARLTLTKCEQDVVLQAGHSKKPTSLRLEFSVNRLGPDGISELADLIDDFAQGDFTFVDVVNHGNSPGWTLPSIY